MPSATRAPVRRARPLQGPQPAAGYFHTVVYDLLAESGPRAASIAALLRCVRSRVFVNELELPFMKEEDEFEGSSRHVLALSACLRVGAAVGRRDASYAL